MLLKSTMYIQNQFLLSWKRMLYSVLMLLHEQLVVKVQLGLTLHEKSQQRFLASC